MVLPLTLLRGGQFTPGGRCIHSEQAGALRGVACPGRQAGEDGRQPGACLPGQPPLLPPPISEHLQSLATTQQALGLLFTR